LAARKTPSQGGKPDKLWKDALRIAALRPDPEGRRKLAVIADKLVDLAMAGDVAAIREIGDRLDGKPAQAITGDDDAPPIKTVLEVMWGGSSGAR
jgi:hypothetical protein